ncbi:hypothetical protein N5923_13775 [Erwiniaceae bacterium BAC15a-03b]|uniref:Uncharacterized protein n=1 Tax=Winslowiella arboricola TaxID=2978220 RepID=A0A9J6PP84_9GAMM|nr:hypothetical protein [Winslowiella arboricola]MCU5772106.1 hypothetical protein [Winslowiella arboricola]MCU5778558.1 hypothetical protein [Winslowiella arboricola]
MNNTVTEEVLRNNGFSDKNIARLNSVLSRTHEDTESYSSLVADLSKRFWGGGAGILMMVAAGIYLMFFEPETGAIEVLAIAFGIAVFWIITPVPLAWKCWRFTSRQRVSN